MACPLHGAARMTARLEILMGAMLLGAPLHAADAGNCSPAQASPAIPAEVATAIESGLATGPRLLAEPRHRITLCGDVPVVKLREGLDRADIAMRVPLRAIDHAPLTLEELVAGVESVDLPQMWSIDGTTRWRIDGDVLVVDVVDASIAAASAFAQMQPFLQLRVNGQNVVIEVSSPSLTADETDLHRASLAARQRQLEEHTLPLLIERLRIARTAAEDPSSIPTGVDELLAQYAGDLEATRTAIVEGRERLQQQWTSMSPADRVWAYGTLGEILSPADRSAIDALVTEQIRRINARVRAAERVTDVANLVRDLEPLVESTPSLEPVLAEERQRLSQLRTELASAEQALADGAASLDRFVMARGAGDWLLGALDEVAADGDKIGFRPALRRRGNLELEIPRLHEQARRERLLKGLQAKEDVKRVAKEILAAQAERDSLRARQLAGETRTRSVPTTYGASCPGA